MTATKGLAVHRRSYCVPQNQFRALLHCASAARSCAIAALVIMLGTVCPSQAEIVYHSANITISEGTYNLDLNGDGVVDFSITSAQDLIFPCNGGGSVSEASASGNGTLFGPLAPGNPIGPDQIFAGDGTLESYLEKDLGGVCWKVDAFGPWVSAKSGYLGFSLQVLGQTYYGWAKLINKGVFTETVVLVGYAYETIPGRAIRAGETSYGSFSSRPLASAK